MAGVGHLILIRHGQSEWNRDERFTGWADIDLTPEGVEQTRLAAAALSDAAVNIDRAFSSVLRRSIRSQWLLLEAMNRMWVPQVLDWRLNERHYGALTGLRRADAVNLHGEAAVHRWRRSYDAEPPPLDTEAAAYVAIDGRYAAVPADQIPLGESLRQTVTRVRGAWEELVAPALRAGQDVAVTAHGNSLRALIKIVCAISDDDLMRLEISNGEPIVYEFDAGLVVHRKRVLTASPQRPSEIL